METASVQTTLAEIKECPKCGSNVYDKFCTKCGVEGIPMPKCEHCHLRTRSFNKFCPHCGKSKGEALNANPTIPVPSAPPPSPPSNFAAFLSGGWLVLWNRKRNF